MKIFSVLFFTIWISSFAQTKMYINKVGGATDSVLLSEIKSISFKSPTAVVGIPPKQGLVAYYPFTGNAFDSSGNDFNGTVYGATLTSDRFGNPNKAYVFDGNDYIEIGDILDSVFCKTVAQFSISGWAKVTTSGLWSNGGMIIGKAAGGPSPYQWAITDAEGNVSTIVASDSTANNYQIKYIYSGINQWVHFVLVFDGSLTTNNRIKLYVNSGSTSSIYNQVGSLGQTTTNTAYGINIGGHRRNYLLPLENTFKGSIDDIRIYNRALSSEEVIALYNAPN